MGTRAAWPFLMEYPDIFAGAILSSGATFAQAYQLEALLGIPIRNYYGADDESNLDVATINTQNEYVSLLFSSLLIYLAETTAGKVVREETSNQGVI